MSEYKHLTSEQVAEIEAPVRAAIGWRSYATVPARLTEQMIAEWRQMRNSIEALRDVIEGLHRMRNAADRERDAAIRRAETAERVLAIYADESSWRPVRGKLRIDSAGTAHGTFDAWWRAGKPWAPAAAALRAAPAEEGER
jgi:hypothetical protein